MTWKKNMFRFLCILLQSMGSSGSSNLSVQMSEDGTEGENMISGNEEDEATDYVFRIITTFKPENLRMCYNPFT